ncbi:MAG: hypothetical protein KAZ87_08020 [Spirochaetes bacterium]|nr:hypothetical protein [Spirochaetota bacterium]
MNKSLFVFLGSILMFACCSGGKPGAEWKKAGEFSISFKTFLDPSGTSIRSSGFENEKRGIALLGPDNIFYTEDGGATWKKSENKVSTRNFLDSLEICGGFVWTTGGNAIRFSADRGKTFDALPDKGSLYRDAILSFCDSKNGWYAQLTENRFAQTSDGGNSWQSFNVPEIGILKSIFLLDENCGFILDDKAVYKTIDGGKSWDKFPLSGKFRSLSSNYLLEFSNAMRFKNTKEGTIVQRTNDSKNKLSVLRTEDGAKSWEKETISLDENIIPGSVFLSRDCKFLTVTDTVNNRFYLYRRQ